MVVVMGPLPMIWISGFNKGVVGFIEEALVTAMEVVGS